MRELPTDTLRPPPPAAVPDTPPPMRENAPAGAALHAAEAVPEDLEGYEPWSRALGSEQPLTPVVARGNLHDGGLSGYHAVVRFLQREEAVTPQAREQALLTLARFLRDPAATETIPPADRALAAEVAVPRVWDPDIQVREAAFAVLALTASEPPALRALAWGLGSDDPRTPSLVAGRLLEMDAPVTVPVLVALLDADAVATRYWASHCLRAQTGQFHRYRPRAGWLARRQAALRWVAAMLHDTRISEADLDVGLPPPGVLYTSDSTFRPGRSADGLGQD